ncbi:transmembrane protein EpsG [Paenibacillus sp. L3-i20]|nr:transmembrane protein EpsG [Paenibacillus sp. L3-i20]
MYVYLLSYITLLVLSLKEITTSRFYSGNINKLIIGCLLVFSIIAGIRYGIGTDYFNYLEIFNYVNVISDYGYLEPGFRFVIVLIKSLGFSVESLFFFFSFITLFYMFYGIKKTSIYPMFSVFLFITVFYIGYVFNGVRQGIAMALFVYLLIDIEQRNFKKVLLYTIIGLTLHFSAIFIMVGYFFSRLKFSRKSYVILTVLLVVAIFTNHIWTNAFMYLMPDYIQTKIDIYANGIVGGIDSIGVLQRLLLLILFLIYYNKLKMVNASFEWIFKLYFLGFVFYAMFSFQEMFATRINMFFRILEIILLPYILCLDINKYKKWSLLIIIIAWATLLFVSQLTHSFNFPFRTIFGK